MESYNKIIKYVAAGASTAVAYYTAQCVFDAYQNRKRKDFSNTFPYPQDRRLVATGFQFLTGDTSPSSFLFLSNNGKDSMVVSMELMNNVFNKYLGMQTPPTAPKMSAIAPSPMLLSTNTDVSSSVSTHAPTTPSDTLEEMFQYAVNSSTLRTPNEQDRQLLLDIGRSIGSAPVFSPEGGGKYTTNAYIEKFNNQKKAFYLSLPSLNQERAILDCFKSVIGMKVPDAQQVLAKEKYELTNKSDIFRGNAITYTADSDNRVLSLDALGGVGGTKSVVHRQLELC